MTSGESGTTISIARNAILQDDSKVHDSSHIPSLTEVTAYVKDKKFYARPPTTALLQQIQPHIDEKYTKCGDQPSYKIYVLKVTTMQAHID